MTFWDNFSWDGSPVSPISALLEDETTTVKQLLDEDQIVSELKRNKNLKDFFAIQTNLEQIIDFLVTPYNGEGEEKYRYPFLSHQIITVGDPQIDNGLLKTESLDQFFDFLYQEAPLDSLLCSYFNKVIAYTLPKYHEKIFEYLQAKDGFLEHMVSHMYSPLITEVIVQFLCSSSDELVDNWFAEINILEGIIKRLEPNRSQEEHENATSILFHIVSLSHQKINAGLATPKLFEQLSSEIFLTRLIDLICQDPSSSAFTEASSIFIILCRDQKDSIASGCTVEELPTVFRVLVAALPKLLQVLSHSTGSEFNTTTGLVKQPFGMRRTRVLILLEDLLCQAHSIFHLFLEQNVFVVCFDLFFAYPWNNFIHHSVTNLARVVLSSNDDDLLVKFLQSTKLHERIGDAGAVPNVDGENSSRKGFMGHLAQLATAIHSASEACDPIADMLDACDSWKLYMKEDFARIKKIETVENDDNESDAASLAEQITLFREVTKKSFEDDFPDSFAPVNEENFDILIQPTDNSLFVGINTDEEEFGSELDSDEDNFMAMDEEEEEEEEEEEM